MSLDFHREICQAPTRNQPERCPMKMLAINDENLHTAIKVQSVLEKKSMIDCVETALRNYLEEKKEPAADTAGSKSNNQ